MEEEKIISERFSLDDWQWKVWLLGNGKTVKEIIKIVIPGLAAFSLNFHPVGQIIVFAVGKFFVDVIDYYIKEQKA